MGLEVLLSCPDVGHGNPRAMYAISNLLERAGASVEEVLLGPSYWLGRWEHRKMSKDAQRSIEYSQNGLLKRFVGAYILGNLGKVEFALRNPELLLGRSGYSHLITTQDIEFSHTSRAFLDRHFPQRFLGVQDVYAKPNGIDFMKNKGFRGIVWEEAGYELLEGLGLDPLLVEPYLVTGSMGGRQLGRRVEKVVAKSSGSGWISGTEDILEEVLRTLGVDFKIYTPREVISPTKRKQLKGNLDERTKAFYDEVVKTVPELLIAGPTEMVQVAAYLNSKRGMKFMALTPERGAHEVDNLSWAEAMGICQETIDLSKRDDIKGKVKAVLDAPSRRVSAQKLGLGTIPLPQALLEAA